MVLFAGIFVDFRDRVLEVGKTAAENIQAFFGENKIVARSIVTALKAFRQLHRSDALDNRITDYKTRLEMGIIIDTTPQKHRCILSDQSSTRR